MAGRAEGPAPATSSWGAAGIAVLDAFDRAAGVTIIVAMVVMVSVVSAQVFLRYALNSSLGWADEVSRLTFVWSIFLAIPLGVRAGAHIGIEIFVTRLPPPVRAALARIIALAGCGVMLIVGYESIVIVIDQWDEKMASLEISAALFIVAVAIGAVHAALHLAWIALTGHPAPGGIKVSAE